MSYQVALFACSCMRVFIFVLVQTNNIAMDCPPGLTRNDFMSLQQQCHVSVAARQWLAGLHGGISLLLIIPVMYKLYHQCKLYQFTKLAMDLDKASLFFYMLLYHTFVAASYLMYASGLSDMDRNVAHVICSILWSWGLYNSFIMVSLVWSAPPHPCC